MMNCSELFMQAMNELAKGSPMTDLVAMLAAKIERGVIVTDAANRIVAHYDPLETDIKVGEFFTLESGDNYIGFPLKAGDKLYGHCIVLCPSQEISIEQTKMLEQMSWIFLLALREKLQNDLARERFLDEIIYDILYNNYDSKIALYEKARHLHWDIDGSYVIIVIEADPDKIHTLKRAAPLQFNLSPPIYTVINEKVVAILSITNIASKQIEEAINSFTTELLSSLVINHIKDVYIGISSTAKALTDLHQCFQEAKIALELGKAFGLGKVNYFEKMGFLKFIFTAPAQELQEFKERVLGKIIAHDLELETDLLDTLKVYIEQQGQIANTAKTLFIHENTLRYRLKKIEQLINLDLSRIEHLVNIYIALRILTLDDYDIR